MKCIGENLAFDQIYHEHLLYYNLETIERLLQRHGLCLFDAYLAPIHGGSIIAFACHAGKRQPSERLQTMRNAEAAAGCNTLPWYREVARRIGAMKETNLSFLRRQASGKTHLWVSRSRKGKHVA